MTETLYSCKGGSIRIPPLVLIDRKDGGNLMVMPPKCVWERCELSVKELIQWTFLVAATGQAMLETLPQLKNGCINYWEAGNWGLNELATPIGTKRAQDYRKVHMHLLGRSPTSTNDETLWGEAPKFPDFVDSASWAAKNSPLTSAECRAIVESTELLLSQKYNLQN